MSQPPPPEQPPEQPPYGNYPPYGGVPYGSLAPPDHPQAMLVLILGIVGLVACPAAAPFAWVLGSRVIGEIDGSVGQVGGRSTANAGRICGIIGTAIIALILLAVIGAIALVLVGAAQG